MAIPPKTPPSKAAAKIIAPSEAAIAPDLYGTPIILVVGDAGSGKSFLCMNHPEREKGIFFDLEDRYKVILKFHPEIKLPRGDTTKPLKLGQYYNCLVYDANYDEDRLKTYDMVQSLLAKAVKMKPKPSVIVVDGIADLRRMCADKWEADNNKTAFGFQAWGDINNYVKKILFRLFNFARIEDINVMTTCFYDDVYENGELSGKKAIGVKNFIIAKVDEILQLSRDGTEFKVKRGKSPKGPKDIEEWTIHAEEGED